jgi:hypothetical protein
MECVSPPATSNCSDHINEICKAAAKEQIILVSPYLPIPRCARNSEVAADFQPTFQNVARQRGLFQRELAGRQTCKLISLPACQEHSNCRCSDSQLCAAQRWGTLLQLLSVAGAGAAAAAAVPCALVGAVPYMNTASPAAHAAPKNSAVMYRKETPTLQAKVHAGPMVRAGLRLAPVYGPPAGAQRLCGCAMAVVSMCGVPSL